MIDPILAAAYQKDRREREIDKLAENLSHLPFWKLAQMAGGGQAMPIMQPPGTGPTGASPTTMPSAPPGASRQGVGSVGGQAPLSMESPTKMAGVKRMFRLSSKALKMTGGSDAPEAIASKVPAALQESFSRAMGKMQRRVGKVEGGLEEWGKTRGAQHVAKKGQELERKFEQAKTSEAEVKLAANAWQRALRSGRITAEDMGEAVRKNQRAHGQWHSLSSDAGANTRDIIRGAQHGGEERRALSTYSRHVPSVSDSAIDRNMSHQHARGSASPYTDKERKSSMRRNLRDQAGHEQAKLPAESTKKSSAKEVMLEAMQKHAGEAGMERQALQLAGRGAARVSDKMKSAFEKMQKQFPAKTKPLSGPGAPRPPSSTYVGAALPKERKYASALQKHAISLAGAGQALKGVNWGQLARMNAVPLATGAAGAAAGAYMGGKDGGGVSGALGGAALGGLGGAAVGKAGQLGMHAKDLRAAALTDPVMRTARKGQVMSTGEALRRAWNHDIGQNMAAAGRPDLARAGKGMFQMPGSTPSAPGAQQGLPGIS